MFFHSSEVQALFLISLQEVTLLKDAEPLPQSVTGHCSKPVVCCLCCCHHALFGPSFLSAHLMPPQQVSRESRGYFSSFSHIICLCSAPVPKELSLPHTGQLSSVMQLNNVQHMSRMCWNTSIFLIPNNVNYVPCFCNLGTVLFFLHYINRTSMKKWKIECDSV